MRRILSLTLAAVFCLIFPSCGDDTPTYHHHSDNHTKNDTVSTDVQPSELDMAVLEELNLARTAPKEYAENYIKPIASHFSAEYVNECIEEMSALEPLSPLAFAMGLWKVAKAHVDSQGPTGKVGHDRVDGQDVFTIMKEYGSYSSAGENISYGYNTAREIIIQLLVDDGVESRGHRKNILSKAYTSAGAATGEHAAYRYECVIDFASGWQEKK